MSTFGEEARLLKLVKTSPLGIHETSRYACLVGQRTPEGREPYAVSKFALEFPEHVSNSADGSAQRYSVTLRTESGDVWRFAVCYVPSSEAVRDAIKGYFSQVRDRGLTVEVSTLSGRKWELNPQTSPAFSKQSSADSNSGTEDWIYVDDAKICWNNSQGSVSCQYVDVIVTDECDNATKRGSALCRGSQPSQAANGGGTWWPPHSTGGGPGGGGSGGSGPGIPDVNDCSQIADPETCSAMPPEGVPPEIWYRLNKEEKKVARDYPFDIPAVFIAKGIAESWSQDQFPGCGGRNTQVGQLKYLVSCGQAGDGGSGY